MSAHWIRGSPRHLEIGYYLNFSEFAVLWEESGLGFTIDSMYDSQGRVWRRNVVLTHFVWADNVYLLSNSMDGLKKMV